MDHKEAKAIIDHLVGEAAERLDELEPKPDARTTDVDGITLEEVLLAHEMVMRQYDDPDHGGILHLDALKAAVGRPDQAVFGVDVHPTVWHKGAALLQSIVQGHLFRNGNKRTGLFVLLYFLDKNGRYPERLPPSLAEELAVAAAADPRLKGENGSRILAVVLQSLLQSRETETG